MCYDDDHGGYVTTDIPLFNSHIPGKSALSGILFISSKVHYVRL